jgi:hypothetical protein
MLKRWFSREFIITLVAISIYYQVAGFLGWSLELTLLGLVLFIPAQAAIQVLYARIAFRWYGRLYGYGQRMRQSSADAESVLAELRTKYDSGARDFVTLAALATAYSHLGRGAEAEPIAQKAQAVIEQRGICQQKTRSARLMCDTAIMLLRDAWTTQGRFGEAAQLLRARIPQAYTPNWFTAIVAYNFFLAEDMYNARVALSHLAPPSQNPRDTQTWIGPSFHFMIPYLRYKLFGDDPRAALYEHEDQLVKWEEDAALNEGNPVGTRLETVLAEIRTLIADERNA